MRIRVDFDHAMMGNKYWGCRERLDKQEGKERAPRALERIDSASQVGSCGRGLSRRLCPVGEVGDCARK